MFEDLFDDISKKIKDISDLDKPVNRGDGPKKSGLWESGLWSTGLAGPVWSTGQKASNPVPTGGTVDEPADEETEVPF
jgi:hypothetical protein